VTRIAKKQQERLYVEEAARLLNVCWRIDSDREHPDFLILDGDKLFGLEVCELFAGHQSEAGSVGKIREVATQRAINDLRRRFEATNSVVLDAKFVGRLEPKGMDEIAQLLASVDFASKPVGSQAIVNASNGLNVYATKALRSNWYSVSDRVGWVDRWPAQEIAEAIEAKSGQLPRYRQAVDDVRLLLVANRLFNSGKLALEGPLDLNTRGFRKVYFLSYPESVAVFDDSRDEERTC
jgi:hypothetical protein